jgi:hypothetical protein
VKALRFSQVRNARHVLDMKGRTAAAIMGFLMRIFARANGSMLSFLPSIHTVRGNSLAWPCAAARKCQSSAGRQTAAHGSVTFPEAALPYILANPRVPPLPKFPPLDS